ncbi:MAG TPA: dephospho-CoA kinase [Gemmatimonadales bacterium]|jgi:dephospho-CoA kinase|nr:dephospho-CoA kinase [Gemmatimonadales bacterium]
MLSVALTGNIASGKSTVTELFRRWGATIIDADALVHEAQAPGTPVLAAIASRFGSAMLRPDGTLDRAALRHEVMNNPAALADLNAIVHPDVHRRRDELMRRAAARGDRIVVSDIPLLFEAADPAAFDVVVLVDAPVEIRRQRLLANRDLSPSDAERMLAAQLPPNTKRTRSDYVIDNMGDLAALERAARKVWEALEARAG